MNQRNHRKWLPVLSSLTVVVGASAVTQLPAAALRYASSIFNPPYASISRSCDGTLACELETAAKYNWDFRKFAEAIAASEWQDSFARQQGEAVLYTVFVPTDAALSESEWEQLMQPENRDRLERFVRSHIVEGAITPAQVEAGSVTTLGGNAIAIVTDDNGEPVRLGTAELAGHHRALNGVLLKVDGAIVQP